MGGYTQQDIKSVRMWHTNDWKQLITTISDASLDMLLSILVEARLMWRCDCGGYTEADRDVCDGCERPAVRER